MKAGHLPASAETRVARMGPAPANASYAVLLVHGRGGSAEDMLRLAEHIALPDIAWLAPEASDRSWWPTSFLAPVQRNAAGLNAGIHALDALHAEIRSAGVAPERTLVIGFSQGACLALEYGARRGDVRGGIVAFSGGLLGTGDLDEPSRDTLYGYAGKRFDYSTRHDDVPVFIGCHERDPHIPLARVHESAGVFEDLGARVITEIYPGAGHGVVDEEVRYVRGLLNRA